ncbi:MAG: protein kinase [Acidobacteriota bacterium]
MDEQMGHYRIVRELGRGAMGVVYLAHEDSLNRTVALKVLAPSFGEGEEDFQRFHREAKSLAQLNHPNIVQIYFVGEDDGRHFFAMEFVPSSLQQILSDEGRLDSWRSAQLILNAASGLAAAHERGIIHRDVKPANLLATEDGTLKVADFGIARIAAAATRLTVADAILGTPRYISPEQCEGLDGDARSDIYSLGVTYYEMLTGRAPYRSTSALALVREILQDTPSPIEAILPEVDSRTRTIVSRMMAKDPADRYQSASELAADLQSHLLSRILPGFDGRIPSPTATHPAPPATVSEPVATPVATVSEPVATVPEPVETPVATVSEPAAAQVATTPLPAAPQPLPTVTAPEPPRVAPPPLPTADSDAASGRSVAETDATATWGAATEDGGAMALEAQPSRPAAARWAIAAFVLLMLGGTVVAAALWQQQPARSALASAAGALERLISGSESEEAPPATEHPAAHGEAAGTPLPDNGPPADSEPQTLAPLPASHSGEEGTTPAHSPAGPEAREWEPLAAGAAPQTVTADSVSTARPARAERVADTRSPRPQIATATPRLAQAGARDEPTAKPRSAKPRPAKPPRGVAMAVWGDEPVIAAALQDYLWGRLTAEVDLASGLTQAQTLVEGQPEPGPFVLTARDHGARHVLLATTTFLRERPLYYYGRHDTAYQSRITLEVVDPVTQKQLGRWSEMVEYTALQTEASIDEVLGQALAEVIDAVR